MEQVSSGMLLKLMVLRKQCFAYLVSVKNYPRKLSPLLIDSLLKELIFLKEMSIFFQKFESTLEV